MSDKKNAGNTEASEFLKRKFQEFREKNTELQGDFVKNDLQSSIAKLQDELKQQESLVQKQAGIINELAGEINRRENMDKKMAELTEQVAKYKEEIASLQAENDRLRSGENAHMEEISSLKAQMVSMQDLQITNLISETNENLDNFIDAISKVKKVDLEPCEVLVLRQKITTLEQEIENQKKLYDKKISDLTSKMAQTAQNRDEYMNNYLKKCKELDQMTVDYNSFKSAVNFSRIEDIYKSEFSANVEKIATGQYQCIGKSAVELNDIHLAQQNILQLKKEIAELNGRLTESQGMLQSSYDAEKSLRQENKTLQDQLKITTTELQNTQSLVQQSIVQPLQIAKSQSKYTPQLTKEQLDSINASKDMLIKHLIEEQDLRQQELKQIESITQQSIQTSLNDLNHLTIYGIKNNINSRLMLQKSIADASMALTLTEDVK